MNPEIQRVDGMLSPEKAMELDRIQEDATNNALNFLDVKTPEDPFPLIAMATGIGKGRIIHKIIDRTVRRNPNAKVLVVAGTKLTLVDQTQSALHRYTLESNGTDHNWQESEITDDLTDETEDISEKSFEQSLLYTTVDYKKRKESNANVHVATIQTVQSEVKNERINPEDYDLVIVDEAHNIGTQARVDTVKKFKNVAGFTATPFRHSGVLKEPEQYGFTIIESLTLPEAQEKDFLPPLIETAIPTDHLVDEIPTNLNGEIDYKKLEKLLKESEDLRPFIADKIQEYIADGQNNKKAVIAVNFVWEAVELARLLKEKGISVGVAVNNRAAREIHSDEIPALDSIEKYKLSKNDPNGLQVLVSPYVASEGFDAPETEVLVWASPTDSSVRYTQFTGRLARRAPGKQFGHVIDFLYQTTQYKWSYNFGQWMKDTVVQLPDGTLFQGSVQQRNKILQSSEFKQIQNTKPKVEIPLEELFGISDLKQLDENDAPVTFQFINEYFVGGDAKNMPLAREVFQEIQHDHPELIVRRINLTRAVNAITDKDLFIQKMQEKGAVLKDKSIEPLGEADYVVTYRNLREIFRPGQNKKMFKVFREVLQELRDENPELVTQRRNDAGATVTVVTNKDYFIQKMVERGALLKDAAMLSIQHGDAVLNGPYLTSHFTGSYLLSIAREVLEEIQQEHPDVITKRKSGTKMVDVVTNEALFTQKMVERGVKIKDTELFPVQTDDMVVNQEFINSYFVGGDRKVRPIVEEVILGYPELVTIRNNRGYNVYVVANLDLFLQRMREKGALLKDRDLQSVQGDDVAISQRSLSTIFSGQKQRVRSVSEEVFEDIRREHPELIVKRKSGKHTVEVVTDRDLFIQKMQERGIMPREKQA